MARAKAAVPKDSKSDENYEQTPSCPVPCRE